MYEQVCPPGPYDLIRQGIPNLRHGTIHQHPLEQLLRKAIGQREENEFNRVAAQFGIGFAEHLKHQRDIAKATEDRLGFSVDQPRLLTELATGQLNYLDFSDMFISPSVLRVAEGDPHDFLLQQVFK